MAASSQPVHGRLGLRASAGPLPPQNLDAEESVLGAMMLSAPAIEAVSEIIDAGDFYRESHAKIYRAALDLYQHGQPGRRDHGRRQARRERRARGGRRQGADPRDRDARARRRRTRATTRKIVREMATLRGLTVVGEQIQRLGWDRPGETPELVDRAEQMVFDLAQHRIRGSFEHIEVARPRELRADHEDVRVRRRDDRHADRLPRHRPDDVGPPAGQPRHRRRPPEHGQVGVRARHRVEPRAAPRHPGRGLHARDVEARGRPAADVLRGPGRAAAPAHRPAHERGLAAPRQGLRRAHEGADLRRRHAPDDDARDPRARRAGSRRASRSSG